MRKPFKSKWLRVNPLELVADRIKPVEKQDQWALDRKLKQANALAALMRGEAKRAHVSDILATHNMAVALQKYKKGREYEGITDRSANALVSLTDRYAKTGKYLLTGEEMNALRDLVDLHNEQLAICTVGEVDDAYRYAIRVKGTGVGTKLNSKFVGKYDNESEEVQQEDQKTSS